MSYQVLARKWRPRVFQEMVGQEHVLKGLINALDNNRLHHAYLFTGTRGVGKTTIARILAKCLNCEQGVSSVPCDQCTACAEINEGRFVDLIEVDAASRTKVEDTRELLDNVQYAPSRGRYKVYLIDEVHMLSGHSFNALLKTLEEPPPHIKFLLATTDPQKLPVTILSRCLQFNLKNMLPERIVEHLAYVLEQEKIPFENSALWQLGRSADGSMRDALSLTDQAIAYGNGTVVEADVSAMLGSIDRSYILDIVKAICANDGSAMLREIEQMAEHSPDYQQALADMIALLHRIAIAQVLPESIDNTFGDREQVLALANELTGADAQLFYQCALLGRRDLPLAPDPRGGFEMVMLRLLAFKPEPISGITKPPVRTEAPADTTEAPGDENVKLAPQGGVQTTAQEERNSDEKKSETFIGAPVDAPASSPPSASTPKPLPNSSSPRPSPGSSPNPSPIPLVAVDKPRQLSAGNWNSLVAQLSVGGVIGNTLSHCQFIKQHDQIIELIVDQEFAHLYDQSHQQRIAQALSDHLGETLRVRINTGEVTAETPAAATERNRAERQAQALQSLRDDPLVQDVIQTFSATLQEQSVVPVEQHFTGQSNGSS